MRLVDLETEPRVQLRSLDSEDVYLTEQPFSFGFNLLLHFFIKAPDFSVMVSLPPKNIKQGE